MHWTDTAIVLTVRKHGENSAIVRVFSREHGVFAGVVRGIQSKTNRGIIQPGNVVSANWQARLSEHIGTFKCELLEAHAAFIMQDSGKLSALTSACAIIDSSLPERHPYPKFYKTFKTFLTILNEGTHWQEAYVKLELELLAEAGFGLDLYNCAATGKTENLVYVSPKSGRAVSEEAGRPYHDKMLPLPTFLLGNQQKNPLGAAEILAGMELTGYFLGSWLLEPHRKKLPAARGRLQQYLEAVDQKRHVAV